MNILLVDDDTDFAQVVAEALREEGHVVSVARDGASAIGLAHALDPDVVLLDIGLPDGDGYEIARALRQQIAPTTPIIVVTGRHEAKLVEDIDLMLNKPIAHELFGGLIEYIRRRRLHLLAKPSV